MKNRLIVGISGATGAAYGLQLLKALKALPRWESHLVLTDAGALNADEAAAVVTLTSGTSSG